MSQKKYIVCIDSDGCVIDSMNVKHVECFGPAFVEVWNLHTQKNEVLDLWNEINLYSKTRGINRYKGLAIILDKLAIENQEDIKEFKNWTKTSSKLSDKMIEEMVEASKNPIFQKALNWSYRVNQLIESLPIPSAFSYVAETLDSIKEIAEIAVISSANKEAILQEWKHNHLLEKVDYIFSQNEGSKKECIAKLVKHNIDKKHILMVGDALGDWEAASENGVWFYPILAENEEQSWNQLKHIYIKAFFQSEFNKELQEELLQHMKSNLNI